MMQNLSLEYQKKHSDALAQSMQKKEQLLIQYPEIKLIEEKIARAGISIARAALNGKDSTSELEALRAEKRALLLKLNIDEASYEPVFECSVCQDTGYIAQTGLMCNCYRQQLLNRAYCQSNLDLLETENFSTFNENLYSTEVNKEKYGINISPYQNILNIKEKCTNFVENFDDINEKSLLFSGETGLGKTFLTNCIAKEIIDRGYSVIYQTAPLLLDLIMDYKMRFDRPDNFNNRQYEQLFNVNLLIIDDLGTESTNSARLSEVFNIINSRLITQRTRNTKTIISTNLSLNGLNSYYADRIVSRIVGEFYICKFAGDDIRLKR